MAVFPFVTKAPLKVPDEIYLPVFREYAYDFINNCLLLRAGRTYLVEKDEALKIWIFHALKVPRYIFRAHSKEYGNELEKVVGSAGDIKTLESERQRYITEAVMVNPYVQELKDFKFSYEGSTVFVTFEVITIYGRFTYDSEVYNG